MTFLVLDLDDWRLAHPTSDSCSWRPRPTGTMGLGPLDQEKVGYQPDRWTCEASLPSRPGAAGGPTDAPVGDAGEVSIEEALAASRRGVRRVSAVEAMEAAGSGALLVDTRTEIQRAEQGELPGALVIDRTVLEWRLDPTSEARIPEAVGYDTTIIVVCRQGYSSSLAAASLRAIGLHNATDLIGGVEAWVSAGLPLHRGPADVRR